MMAVATYPEQKLSETVTKIKSVWSKPLDVALILGSGLGHAYTADAFNDGVALSYDQIPHFPHSTVEGHAGELVFGTHRSGKTIGVMRGRFHLYEGYDPADVTYPIRVFRQLGAQLLIVTNAAGGVNLNYRPGDLMVITDHLNLTGLNPLRGKNWDEQGPRFPDMSQIYCPKLEGTANAEAAKLDLKIHQGVYAGVMGPSYETPAEIRMLQTLGADAVGMSTVHEAIVARHAGMNVFGLSLITNLAAGLQAGHALSHQEVLDAAKAVSDKLPKLIDALLG